MVNRLVPPNAKQERRKQRRYEVQLPGELRQQGLSVKVQIMDISASGALIFTEKSPVLGSKGELWLEDFGVLPIEIVHVGHSFAGLTITQTADQRDKLLRWLRADVSPTVSGKS